MTAHANRSKRPDAVGSNPTPAVIRGVRESLRLTPLSAALLASCTVPQWERFEAGRVRMHPAIWAAFKLRAAAPAEYDCAMRAAHVAIATAEMRADLLARHVKLNLIDPT